MVNIQKHLDEKFLKAIRYPFTRVKIHEENIEDILDGSEYKRFDFLKNYGNISFIFFNSDGLSVFKSGNQQLWPIYAVINELPPDIRYSILFYSIILF